MLLFVVSITAFMLIKAWMEPIKYPATLTFMVNEDEGGRAGGAIAGLLGQFGFSTGSSGKCNLTKILELSRSRRIIQEALYENVKISGHEDFMANHIIRLYDYHDHWDDTKYLKGFLFTQDSVELFSETENRALLTIYGQVVGNADNDVEGLLKSSFGDETSIMKMSVNSLSEKLSLTLAKATYDHLSRFYIEKATEKQEQTFRLIKEKADSLLNALNGKQLQLLKFEDSYRNLPLLQHGAKGMNCRGM